MPPPHMHWHVWHWTWSSFWAAWHQEVVPSGLHELGSDIATTLSSKSCWLCIMWSGTSILHWEATLCPSHWPLPLGSSAPSLVRPMVSLTAAPPVKFSRILKLCDIYSQTSEPLHWTSFLLYLSMWTMPSSLWLNRILRSSLSSPRRVTTKPCYIIHRAMAWWRDSTDHWRPPYVLALTLQARWTNSIGFS